MNNVPQKQSDDTISSAEPDNITQKQQTENMETHAHHLHEARPDMPLAYPIVLI